MDGSPDWLLRCHDDSVRAPLWRRGVYPQPVGVDWTVAGRGQQRSRPEAWRSLGGLCLLSWSPVLAGRTSLTRVEEAEVPRPPAKP